MSIVDQAAQQATTPTMGQNMTAGMELSQRQQALDMQAQHLELAKQQATMQKQNYLVGTFQKALSTEDPGMRSVLLNHVQKVGENWQMPISDDVYDLAHKSEEYRATALQDLKKLDLMNPADRAAALPKIASYLGTDAAEAVKGLGALTEPQEKIVAAQMQAAAFGNRLAASGQIARLKYTYDQAVKAGAPAELLTRLAQGDETAVPLVSPYVQKFQAQVGGDKHELNQSKIANTDSMIDYRKARAQQFGQMLQARWASLGIQQKRMKMAAEKAVDDDSVLKGYETNIVGAAKAQNILSNPDATWQQLREANIDIAQLQMVKPSAVVPVYREEGLNPRMFQQDVAKLETYFSGKYQGQIPTELRSQLNDILQRLTKVAQVGHDTRLLTKVGSMQAAKTFDPDEAQMEFERRKFGDSSQYQPPAAAAKAKPYTGLDKKAAPGPTPQASLKVPSKSFLDAVTKQIPDPALRNAWLKSKGYQIEGVQ